MSKTLFWYIFWSLLKVFLMTTASLAGIMSLGGLLRPLTDNGLNLGQVNRMLAYLTPAMCTYSLPVAALFAATTVYGRFAADNELTAMRACGISYLSARRFSIALPALVLGLVVAVASLLMLCFIVPLFSLKAQEVIYSNIGRLIVSRIEREHELDFPTGIGTNRFVVFAEEAHSIPPNPQTPQVSRVELIGPAVVTYEPPVFPDPILTPKEFWMARTAIVNIARSGAEGGAALTVQLEDGIRFPREFYGGSQVGVAGTTFGPTPRQSLIGENVKFMNVTRLTELAQDPGQSERVQLVLRDMIRRDQELAYRAMIVKAFRPESADASGHAIFDFGKDVDQGDRYQIGGHGVKAGAVGDEVIVGPLDKDLSKPFSAGPRFGWFEQMHGSQQIIQGDAGELRISTKPDLTGQQIIISVELNDAALHTQSGVSERASFSRSFAVPMPPEIENMAKRTLADYLCDPNTGPGDAALLRHEEAAANNAVRSELHSRASFAVSCLSLVMIGCALGMMFRSGNFLNAFAVSFVPALLCITLIVCGQQCATHVPDDVAPGYHDPLHLGLAFIWAGNISVTAAVIWFTIRLQRQ